MSDQAIPSARAINAGKKAPASEVLRVDPQAAISVHEYYILKAAAAIAGEIGVPVHSHPLRYTQASSARFVDVFEPRAK